MVSIKNEYKSFLDDIEKNIKDKEDLEYIKKRFADFLDVVLEKMDYILDYKEEEMNKLEEKQNQIEAKMAKMQKIIDNIENDIYSEDGYDFEITCPYCNYEFIIDVDETKTEVQCPECKNMIELDWNEGEDDTPNNSRDYNDEDDDM